MSDDRTIWGVHQEWDEDSLAGMKPSTVAVGWPAMGDLGVLPKTREAFQAAFGAAYPDDKPGAVPVKAGVLFRFANQMRVGDVVVYPSKADRLVNIGIVSGDYQFQPNVDAEYPHRRRVDWKVQTQRAKYSQTALYEIGSAVTLFQVTNNAEEFLAALEGKAFEAAEVDAVSEQAVAIQVEENVEDFVVKRIMSAISHEKFEHLIAE